MQKIQTALLSYGMSGKVFHAPFLNVHPGFELVGSWERSQTNIQKDYPNVQSFNSLESILNNPSIDLIVVNTPVATHFDYAQEALLAGKHVVVEKAFTATLEQAKILQRLAFEKKLKLAVFQNRRWDSDFLTVQSIVNQGVLGELVEAEFHFDRYNPNLSPKIHKETSNDGAGILKDLGPHLIDQALCLFGMPERVFAHIRKTRNLTLVDDHIDIFLYYKSLTVRLKASFFIKEPSASYILHGKKGSFLKPRADVQEEQLKTGQKPNLTTWGTEPIAASGYLNTEIDGKSIAENVESKQGNYYHFYDLLHKSITQNREEPVTSDDGVRVMTIIEKAIESQELQKVVYI